MTTYSLNLESALTNQTSDLDEILFYDRTTLNVSLTGLSEEVIPLYLDIDWGDGTTNLYENEINKDYTTDDITPEVLYGKYSSILLHPVSHDYKPSSSALYKSLTATFTVEYANEDLSVFVVPLKIRTNDYFESIYDMTLIHTNIIASADEEKEHQFLTERDGYLIEMRTATK